MEAGELRERVTLQAEVKTPDDRKGATVAWQDVCTVACAVDEAWVRERLVNEAMLAEGGVAIRLRYRTGIDATMRAVVASGPFAGTYNVHGVQVILARGSSRAEALALACTRGGVT